MDWQAIFRSNKFCVFNCWLAACAWCVRVRLDVWLLGCEYMFITGKQMAIPVQCWETMYHTERIKMPSDTRLWKLGILDVDIGGKPLCRPCTCVLLYTYICVGEFRFDYAFGMSAKKCFNMLFCIPFPNTFFDFWTLSGFANMHY